MEIDLPLAGNAELAPLGTRRQDQRIGGEALAALEVQRHRLPGLDLRHPAVLEQLSAQADRMTDDEETQFLLRCVIDDERASLALVQQAHEMLCGS